MAAPTEDEILEEEEEIEEEEAVEEEPEESEAPVRKSASYYVGLRQGKREAKKELAEKEGDDDDEDDVELKPEARKAIRKEVAPLMDALKKNADDIEVREYFAENPGDRKIEKAIRRRMEAWPTVPVAEIAKTIKFGTEQKERITKREEVVAATKGKALKGSPHRAEEPKLPSTPEEFKDIYARVKKGEKIKLGE